MATETRALQKPGLNSVQLLLERYRNHIDMALSGNRHITPERMIRVALTAMSQNTKLQECNPYTICGAIIQASLLGLEPNSTLGECFLVPFWNNKSKGYDCQLIVGYHGKIKLVANTGQLVGVKAAPIHQHDEFELDDGIEPYVRHKYFHVKDRGPVIGYWAGAKLKSGFTSIAYMTVKEVEEHRDKFAKTRNRDGEIFGVWVENFEAMALKTVVHKCLKYCPKSAQAQTAWDLDEKAEANIPQMFSVDVPAELQPVQADSGEPEVEMPKRASEIMKESEISGASDEEAPSGALFSGAPDDAPQRRSRKGQHYPD